MFVDCVTAWVEDDAERERVFALFRDTPVPLGWGSEGMAAYGAEEWRNPVFTPLRLEPWRVQVMRGDESPAGHLTGLVWHGA